MNLATATITYVLIVILFAVLFKYGVHLSFGIDPGYVGPIFIWHAILVVGALVKGQSKQ